MDHRVERGPVKTSGVVSTMPRWVCGEVLGQQGRSKTLTTENSQESTHRRVRKGGWIPSTVSGTNVGQVLHR